MDFGKGLARGDGPGEKHGAWRVLYIPGLCQGAKQAACAGEGPADLGKGLARGDWNMWQGYGDGAVV